MATVVPGGGLLARRYHVHELLGSGGMGAVYRATDRLSGRAVALKRVRAGAGSSGILRTPNEDDYLRLSLAREFRLLASLRHPHVIEVLDYGFDDQRQPYVTMELLREPRTILRSGRGQPIEAKVGLLVQLLHALAYLHRRGILHRDLKPSNVLVAEGRLRVLDFGLAEFRGGAAGKVGTLAYMPPEVLRGEPAAERSDLYAVGVTAYELLAGRHPFALTDVESLVGQILSSQVDLGPLSDEALRAPRTEPAAQSEWDDTGVYLDELPTAGRTLYDLPPEGAPAAAQTQEPGGALATVVARLMARRPEDRPADALEAAALLCQAIGRDLPAPSARIRESFLQAARFVGRSRELAELTAALENALRGTGSAWLVAGESGVGKTRLLDELLPQALVSGALVLRGQAVSEGGGPYEAWREPLRRLALAANSQPRDAAVLAAVDAEIPGLLGSASPTPVATARTEAAHLQEAVSSLFRSSSDPIVLVLEDLQWAGEEALQLLRLVAALAEECPLLVLASARLDERPDLVGLLGRMALISISRLGESEVGELAASMLGPVGTRPELVELLLRETEGNVFLLVEVVRALAEEAGGLEAVKASALLPAGVSAGGVWKIVRRRLERVPEHARPLLAVAAVAGRVVERELLRALAPEIDLEAWFQVCAQAAVLDIEEDRWRFAHDKLREGALQGLEPDQRRELHDRVAAALEGLGSAAPERLTALAHHYIQAERWERAAEYLLRSADSAVQAYALAMARAHFAAAREALRRLPDTDANRRRRIDAIVQQVEISLFAESPDANLVLLEEAQALLAGGPQPPAAADRRLRARVLHAWGRVHYVRNETTLAISCFRQVLALAQESGDEELLVLPTSVIGRALAVLGEYAQAEPLLARAAPLLDQSGNWREWPGTEGFLGVACAARGDYRAGRAHAERVLERGLDSGDTVGATVGHILLAHVLLTGGELEHAVREAAAGVRQAEGADERVYIYVGLAFQALAECRLGRLPDAVEHFSRAQAIGASLGRVFLAEFVRAVEAELLLAQGRAAAAASLAKETLQLARQANNRHVQGLAHRVIAAALASLEPEGWPEAEQHLAESIAVLEGGDGRVEAARTRLVWGDLLLARGDAAGARTRLTEAASLFETCGLATELGRARRRLQALGGA